MINPKCEQCPNMCDAKADIQTLERRITSLIDNACKDDFEAMLLGDDGEDSLLLDEPDEYGLRAVEYRKMAAFLVEQYEEQINTKEFAMEFVSKYCPGAEPIQIGEEAHYRCRSTIVARAMGN